MDSSWAGIIGVTIGAIGMVIVEVIRRKRPSEINKLQIEIKELKNEFNSFKKALSLVLDQLERDTDPEKMKLLRDFRKSFRL